MRDKVEVFLSENPSESFKAGEIAKQLEMPKGEVKRRLKKLAKQGRAEVKKGRYRASKALEAERIKPPKMKAAVAKKDSPSSTIRLRSDSSTRTNRSLEAAARSVGLRVEILQRWVDERKKRASDEDTKKVLYGVLHDLEISRGMKARDMPER